MQSSLVEDSPELSDLFRRLVREIHAAGGLPALGTDGPQGPYLQVRSRPERREQAARLSASSRTTVRLYPHEAYLRFLENTFPSLHAELVASCRPGRPFLVVEGWLRYVKLGERLLRFARDNGLNLRYVDYQRGESRLNGVRVTFDHTTQRWRASEGSVEELLRDPRGGRRSWMSALDPRWRLARAGRFNGVLRRAASLAS